MSDKTTRTAKVKMLLATTVLCLMLGGCGDWIGDPVVEVIGEVTLDRKVLTDALVVFVPVRFRNDEGLINPLAFGKTDGTGRFELKSGEHKGVLSGRYRVLIYRNDVETDERKVDDSASASSQSIKVNQRNASEVIGNKLATLLNEPAVEQAISATVPLNYNLHSELEYVVKMPAGAVYPKFELTSN